uniref:Uncharacterized protein n=1 Tax=Oryza glumipatula TaxID=40148 RepID=A0A0E0A6E0_9ORYZ
MHHLLTAQAPEKGEGRSPARGEKDAATGDAAAGDVHRRLPSTALPLTPTLGSICVAGRCALHRRPNSVAGPLWSAPSSPAVDPVASPGLHPIHLLLWGSKETRWCAKNLLTWSWLAVECGRIIFYVNHMIPGRYHLIPVRYQDLKHHKHHPPRGKNRMIPDRISFVKPDDTRHDTYEDHDTSQVSHDPPKVSPMKPGETGHDTKEDHDTSQIYDPTRVSLDTSQLSSSMWYQTIPITYQVILVRYHVIPIRYQELGVEVSRHRRRWPRPPPSTLHTEPKPRRRQPHPPPSMVHIGTCRRRPRPLSGARHRQPRLSSTPQLAAASSTLELVSGATAITTQDPPPSTPHAGARHRHRLCHHADPPPSMRPCPTPELAGGRVLHAGARRRQPHPPRRRSSAPAASAPPALAASVLLPRWPALSRLREVDRERSRWDTIPTGYRCAMW